MKEYKKDGKEINNKTNKQKDEKERKNRKNQIRKKERTGEKKSGPL